MTQVHCKWIVENPRWLLGRDGGGVQTCYRVQRSVEKDMAQDSEKLGKKIVCEEKGKKYSQGQTKEFVDTKETA